MHVPGFSESSNTNTKRYVMYPLSYWWMLLTRVIKSRPLILKQIKVKETFATLKINMFPKYVTLWRLYVLELFFFHFQIIFHLLV